MDTKPIRAETYTCAMCLGSYKKTWSDEEALAEKNDIFGPVPIEECSLVCDDCFRRIMPPAGETRLRQ